MSIGLEIDDREHAATRRREAGDDAARIERARFDRIVRIAALRAPQRIRGADVHEVRFGIERARRPVHRGQRLPHGRRLRERREDASLVHQLEAFRRECRWTAARRHRRRGRAAWARCAAAAPASPGSRRCRAAACRCRDRGCTPSRSCRPPRCPCAVLPAVAAHRTGSPDSASRSPRCRDEPAGSASGTSPSSRRWPPSTR